MAEPDVVVLGAGVAGLIAALRIARSARSVVLMALHPPLPSDPRRVDAVPARYLELLVELGLPPTTIEAEWPPPIRRAAWERETPESTPGPQIAHVERPALELALLTLLRREHRSTIRFAPPLRPGQYPAASGRGARKMIDASGRAAVTAGKLVRPPRPWVARTFTTERARCEGDPGFAIAALPDGYAYRLGSAANVTIGIVGRGTSVSGSTCDIECRLGREAPWLIEGLPALAQMRANKAKPASVQWSEGPGLRIGDAALARDALSSQGIVGSSTEAMLAAAWENESDLQSIHARQYEQRRAHLKSLLGTIERCRYADRPVWRDYRAFLTAHVETERPRTTAALRAGRIETVSL
jgi:FAD binding domain